MNTLFQQRSDQTLQSGSANIKLDANTEYQEMDGFGFTYTQGSAYTIATLSEAKQDELLNLFFNPETGIGVSTVRLSIGACDLSSGLYTYADNGPDEDLSEFSLAGPDLDYLIPQLKKVVEINPHVRFLATPWSAPKWMKTKDDWQGGSLKTEYYSVFADYFVKYIQAMNEHGLRIWGITPQNEPKNAWNHPSMEMTYTEQIDFINNHLGPAFAAAGITTKIIGYDHNLDDTNYAIQVANQSNYVYGSAFHKYGGNTSDMANVYNQTGKKVFMTEQYTGAYGNPWWDFKWHQENIFIGAILYNSSMSLGWNFSSDENWGPRTHWDVCSDCLGAVTVKNNGTYELKTTYANVAQYPRFVHHGAMRVGVSGNVNNGKTAAFVNPDGSRTIVIYTPDGSDQNTSIGEGNMKIDVTLKQNSVTTFTWQPNDIQAPIQADVVDGEYYLVNRATGKYMQASGSGNGDAITLENSNSTNAQKFFVYQEASGQYVLMSYISEKLVDIDQISLKAGAEAQIWEDQNSDNQRFYIVPAQDNGYVHLRSVHSGMDLMAEGSMVIQNSPSNSQDSQWELAPAGIISAGFFDYQPITNITVYPNPAKANGPITIQGDFSAGLELEVYDVRGSLVGKTLTDSQIAVLDFDLQPGLYFVRHQSLLDGTIKQWKLSVVK